MLHDTFQGLYVSGFDLQAQRWTQVAPTSFQDTAKMDPTWPKMASTMPKMAFKIIKNPKGKLICHFGFI